MCVHGEKWRYCKPCHAAYQRAFRALKSSGLWVRKIRKQVKTCGICNGPRTWPKQYACRVCHAARCRRWRQKRRDRELELMAKLKRQRCS